MKQISLLAIFIYLLGSWPASADGKAKIPDRDLFATGQFASYREAAEQQHILYLKQVEVRQTKLREATPHYQSGSFYGALPADTRWAKQRITDRQIMERTYAENRYPQKELASQVVIAEHNPRRANPALPQLTRYIAPNDPAAGDLRPVHTSAGIRIPATTLLTAEGMQLQANVGCGGCHQH